MRKFIAGRVQIICGRLESSPPKSVGHLAWISGNREAYVANGQVYIANRNAAFTEGGYRHGRWECSHAHWQQFFDTVWAQQVEDP